MKTTTTSFVCSLLFAASLINSHGWIKVGHVYCDGNTNGTIDAGDLPVQSVLVVVTNVSGTFSGASWTTAEGLFVIQLADVPDQYVDYIHPASLPQGTTVVLPGSNLFSTSETNSVITNNFLIENPACTSLQSTGHCWLTGGGRIRSGGGQPPLSFAGVVNPGGRPHRAGGGGLEAVN